MALGATTGDVAGLVLSQSVRPVGIGLAGWRWAGRGAGNRIHGDAHRLGIGNLVRVFDPVAYIARAC